MSRLFVFDLDGTLVDSLRDLADSARGRTYVQAERFSEVLADARGHLQAARGDAGGGACEHRAAGRPREVSEIYDARLLTHTRP